MRCGSIASEVTVLDVAVKKGRKRRWNRNDPAFRAEAEQHIALRVLERGHLNSGLCGEGFAARRFQHHDADKQTLPNEGHGFIGL
jgi:hypothetical protein